MTEDILVKIRHLGNPQRKVQARGRELVERRQPRDGATEHDEVDALPHDRRPQRPEPADDRHRVIVTPDPDAAGQDIRIPGRPRQILVQPLPGLGAAHERDSRGKSRRALPLAEHDHGRGGADDEQPIAEIQSATSGADPATKPGTAATAATSPG
jgi:hypothetical protein